MEKVIAFTDGASRNNPGKGGWGTVVIYPKSSGDLYVDELGGADAHTTNNRMEISAFKAALEHMNDFYEKGAERKVFTIYTDSSYVRNSFTKWIEGWAENNWMTKGKTPVLNADLWSEVSSLKDKLSKQFEFDIRLLKGHSGIAGNERCDVIATTFADGEPTDLYKGKLSTYTISDILNTKSGVVENSGGKLGTKKSSPKGNPMGYVSAVDGVVERHKTWAECEKRVKGTKGAKFKKYFSEQNCEEIISEWGIK
jgi:ribonuclease HI